MIRREEILASLEPLFKDAREKKKWFLSTYQAMTFSPVELRTKHANGELIWGPVNWTLVSPPKFLNPQDEYDKAVRYNADLKLRIDGGWE